MGCFVCFWTIRSKHQAVLHEIMSLRCTDHYCVCCISWYALCGFNRGEQMHYGSRASSDGIEGMWSATRQTAPLSCPHASLCITDLLVCT